MGACARSPQVVCRLKTLIAARKLQRHLTCPTECRLAIRIAQRAGSLRPLALLLSLSLSLLLSLSSVSASFDLFSWSLLHSISSPGLCSIRSPLLVSASFDPSHAKRFCRTAAFSADNRFAATGAADGTVKILVRLSMCRSVSNRCDSYVALVDLGRTAALLLPNREGREAQSCHPPLPGCQRCHHVGGISPKSCYCRCNNQ
jgi:hypothetical protein